MLQRKQFSLESLEKREMMAGDVSVAVSNGDLLVQGDANDNFVEIYRLSSGNIRVQGIGTTVNGRSNQSFAVTDDIFVTMQQGENDVVFRNYNGGVRADWVRINMGNGDDRVDINGLHARGDVEIFTWGGDDDIQIENSSVGSQLFDREDLRIRSGSGNDYVKMFNVLSFGDVDIDTFDNVFADEDDRIDLQRLTVFDDLRIDTGGGDDDVFVRFSTIHDDLAINTGGGSDYAWLDQNDEINDLDVNMGTGNDTAVVYRTEARRADLNGGTGFDRLFTFNNDIDSLDHTGFEQRTLN